MQIPYPGIPTKLIRKSTLVTSYEDRLPVHTLTFAIPEKSSSFLLAQPIAATRLDLGDVVKIVIPNYKPKSYSVSALRVDAGEFDVTVKVYPNGRSSGYLDRLKVGDTIKIFGKSKRKTRNHATTYVGIIAFGVGITEALPVAQAELENPNVSTVCLLWATRTMSETFWHDKIDEMRNKYGERFEIIHLLSREQKDNCRYGRINTKLLADVFKPHPNQQPAFLSVGTKQMMKQSYNMLHQIGFLMPQHQLLIKNKCAPLRRPTISK